MLSTEVRTNADAILFLRRVLRYLFAYYGGTYAAHLVSIAILEVEGEQNG